MDEAGFLRSASGREVSAGVAVSLLKDAAHPIGPSGFRRGPLTEGHQALSPAPAGIVGGPAQGRAARTGPAGPVGHPGSGTADRSMGADEDDDLVPGSDEDGEGVGPSGVAVKGLVPTQFHRPYLSAGHAASSPAVTGERSTTPVPASDPVEPQDYGRGWIYAAHQVPSPGDGGDNNPNPPGSAAEAVYASGAHAYGENQRMARAEHVMPSGSVVSSPAASRMAVPSDMRASDVPVHVAMQATRPSPGEVTR
jgi:hypothetical protein